MRVKWRWISWNGVSSDFISVAVKGMEMVEP
jgi:hypothetical protein